MAKTLRVPPAASLGFSKARPHLLVNRTAAVVDPYRNNRADCVIGTTPMSDGVLPA